MHAGPQYITDSFAARADAGYAAARSSLAVPALPLRPPLPPHPQILGRFIRYMSEVGQADQVPMSKHGADLARV